MVGESSRFTVADGTETPVRVGELWPDEMSSLLVLMWLCLRPRRGHLRPAFDAFRSDYFSNKVISYMFEWITEYILRTRRLQICVLIRRYNFVLDHCFSNGYHCRIEKRITSCLGSCVQNTSAAGFSLTCNNQSKAHSNTCQFLKVTHNKCITLSKGCPPTWPRALACAAVSTSPVAKKKTMRFGQI